MAIDVRIETFAAICEEVQPLLPLHWQEVAAFRDDIPLAPNFARYAALEAAGRLLVVTARADGVLAGYAAFVWDFPDHYATTLWADCKLIFVVPQHRRGGAARAMLGLAVATLKAKGCCVVQVRAKRAHPALCRLLEAMGMEPQETVYASLLQKPE